MKTEERIREELQKLKSEQNPNNANKIEVLEWVLSDCEPLDGFYVISGSHEDGEDIFDVVKGLDNAKNMLASYAVNIFNYVGLYTACVNKYGLVDVDKRIDFKKIAE